MERHKHPRSSPDWDAYRNPPSLFWPGYFWMLNDKLGRDKMLAQIREMHARWAAKLGKEWPVKDLGYDARTVEFEKESLASGLFGPVRLVISK